MNDGYGSDDGRQNIVLISVDSLRADFCPWLGYRGVATPSISELSEEGVSFENAVAPGQETPDSMPIIFTRYPRSKEGTIPASINDLLGAHEPIPRSLQKLGYETIGFTPNPYTSRRFGFDTGFDHFEDFLSNDTRALGNVRSWIRSNLDTKPAQAVRLVLNVLGQGDLTVTWKDYYSELLSRVERANEPFFLWVFLLEPHWPYVPSKAHRDGLSWLDFFANLKRSRVVDQDPTEKDRKRLLKLYERTILDVDDFVHEIQTDLAEYDPVYVFHSDHGESFGEHGNWGHKGYLHDENVRVPLEIWNAGSTERIKAPISLREVPNIVMDIAHGRTGSWSRFTSPYATARLSPNECSLVGDGWIHYPEGGVSAPAAISDLCDRLYDDANARHAEYEWVRSAAMEVAAESREL